MPTTQLPEEKEKAAEISRRIANTRPSTRDKGAPDGQVSGGFNQKSHQEVADKAVVDKKLDQETSASDGDGQ